MLQRYEHSDLVIPGSDGLIGFAAGDWPHSLPEALFDVIPTLKVLYRLKPDTAIRTVQLMAPFSQKLGRWLETHSCLWTVPYGVRNLIWRAPPETIARQPTNATPTCKVYSNYSKSFLQKNTVFDH